MTEQITSTEPKKKRIGHNYTFENKTFTSVKDLVTYLVTQRKLAISERIIQCKYCGMTFGNNSILGVHYFNKHSDKIRLM